MIKERDSKNNSINLPHSYEYRMIQLFMEHLAILKPSQDQIQLRDLRAPYSTREWRTIRKLISPLQVQFGIKLGIWPNANGLQERAALIDNQPQGSKWKYLIKTNEEALEELRMHGLLGYSTSYATGSPMENYALRTYGPMPPEIREMYEAAFREGRLVQGNNILDQWLFSMARPDMQLIDLKYEIKGIEKMYEEHRWYRSIRDPQALEIVIQAGSNWMAAVKEYWTNK